ncbi:hypothetical protein Hanom_Chr11g01057591 [Helianthus anomalus]
MRYDLCGDRPAVIIDIKNPSKLQWTKKDPDLMPFKAFFATSSAFIEPEDPNMMFVNGGLLLFSATTETFIRISSISSLTARGANEPSRADPELDYAQALFLKLELGSTRAQLMYLFIN